MNAECQQTRKRTWTIAQIIALFERPFLDLLYEAQTVHRQHFPAGSMQLTTLLNIKVGGCPEDCHYCPQAARYHTGVKAKKLLSADAVREQALAAKAAGSTRFCMSAAWRELKDRDLPAICNLIREVKELGLESCLTLGMITESQAQALKEAGLDYYNHNIDSSEEFYEKIITTRTYQDRLQTLQRVRDSGMKVCCGGIIGMGESRADRAGMIFTLANLDPHPESVPINLLASVDGTPLENRAMLDPIEAVRTIAVARIVLPKARVRLAAGRIRMTDEWQALSFLAGANSIFYGREILNTTENPAAKKDLELLTRLGIPIENSPEFQEAATEIRNCSVTA